MQLPESNARLIYADPPWQFKAGTKGRPQHYQRMTLADICEMDVAACAAQDCWLFMWTTGPHLEQAFRVIKAWGFKYSGIGFTWIKLNPRACRLFYTDSDLHMGGGYTTRKNAELCLLAKRGRPKRLRKDVREVIISPRREHSRKPDEMYERLEAFADGPYLELFARTKRPGWDSWGNETEKFT